MILLSKQETSDALAAKIIGFVADLLRDRRARRGDQQTRRPSAVTRSVRDTQVFQARRACRRRVMLAALAARLLLVDAIREFVLNHREIREIRELVRILPLVGPTLRLPDPIQRLSRRAISGSTIAPRRAGNTLAITTATASRSGPASHAHQSYCAPPGVAAIRRCDTMSDPAMPATLPAATRRPPSPRMSTSTSNRRAPSATRIASSRLRTRSSRQGHRRGQSR